jgi:hypothetical protein
MIRHGDDHVSIQRKTRPILISSKKSNESTIKVPAQPSSLITKEYMRTGRLPDPRNDTLVSVYGPGMHLDPIASPYDVPTGATAGDIDSGV